MYPSNFWEFPTLVSAATSGCTRNQPTNQPKMNKMVATGSQIKMTIDDVCTIFNANTGNAIKTFDGRVEGDMGNIINFICLMLRHFPFLEKKGNLKLLLLPLSIKPTTLTGHI